MMMNRTQPIGGRKRINATMNEFSAEDFGEFEEEARKLGITPSQLLKSIITGKSTEEIKRDFIRATWPKPVDDRSSEPAALADARTELAIRRQANLMGFETSADYLTQMIATTLASNDENTVITRDGRLVHRTDAYDSDRVPQD